MERFIYLDGKFVGRVSNTAQEMATYFNAQLVSVTTFVHPVCGESEEVQLATKTKETQQ